MSAAQVVCRACGRVVTASPIRPGAPLDKVTWYTVDDHEGADGRCSSVGDVVIPVTSDRWKGGEPWP